MALYENVLFAQMLAGADYAAGTFTGTVTNFTGYQRVTYLLNSGTNGANGTVDVAVYHAATATATKAAITSAEFVQLTTSNDNAIYALDVPVTSATPHQTVVATVVTTCDFGVSAIGVRKILSPVTQSKTVVVV